MSGNWRISTFNGALLAAYFIPAWTITAFNIILSPIHGLYERPTFRWRCSSAITCSFPGSPPSASPCCWRSAA
jgi:hypothetical protein